MIEITQSEFNNLQYCIDRLDIKTDDGIVTSEELVNIEATFEMSYSGNGDFWCDDWLPLLKKFDIEVRFSDNEDKEYYDQLMTEIMNANDLATAAEIDDDGDTSFAKYIKDNAGFPNPDVYGLVKVVNGKSCFLPIDRNTAQMVRFALKKYLKDNFVVEKPQMTTQM